MAIALTAPVDVHVGQTIVWSVTGATVSGNVRVEMVSEAGGLTVDAVVAADNTGAYSSSGKLDTIPNDDEPVTITVTDVTGGSSASAVVKVFQSE